MRGVIYYEEKVSTVYVPKEKRPSDRQFPQAVTEAKAPQEEPDPVVQKAIAEALEAEDSLRPYGIT
jgi:hypothetical protein